MTDIEKTKAEIKVLETKLSFLEEIEKHNAKTKMTDLQKLQNKNWNVNMNHRTPYKPEVQYYDEQMVIVDGVQYQRVEPPKPQTLYEALCEKSNVYANVSATVCEIVKEWMPNTRFEDGNDYNIGWNDCLQHLKENLK
jgi:hypothetical protein